MRTLLSEVFDPRSMRLNLEGKTKEEVFIELINAITVVHPECDSTSILASLKEREDKQSFRISSVIAMPHAYFKGINNIVGAIGISQTGIEYDAMDLKPVNIVLMLVIGKQAEENHLHILCKLFEFARSEAIGMIKNARDVQAIQNILSNFP